MASGQSGYVKAITPLNNTSRYPDTSESDSAVKKRQKIQSLNKNNSNTNPQNPDRYPRFSSGKTQVNKRGPSSTHNPNNQSNTTEKNNSRYLTVDDSSRDKSGQTSLSSVNRQSTFTSSQSKLPRKETFVRSEDEEPQSGLKIPRIDSASMSSKDQHVIRKGTDDRVKEANVFIVDGDDEIDKVDNDRLDKEKSDNKTEKSSDNTFDENNKDNDSNNEEPVNMDTEDAPENSDKLEKSLDLKSPFKVPNKTEKPKIVEPAGGTDRDKVNLSPSKSPIPGEPVLHKKSNYTSQHKKKEVDMAQVTDDKPLDDDRVEKLTDMLNDMGQKLAEAEEENKRLRQDNVDLREELTKHHDSQQKTNSEIELIKSEWSELTKQLESTSSERESLKKQLDEQGDNATGRVKELTEQRSALESEVIQLKLDMKDLLKARESENQSHETIVNSLKEDIVSKEAEYETTKLQYEKEIKELKDIIEKLKQEISELKITHEALEKDIKKLKETIEALEREINDLKRQNKLLNDQCENYQQKIKLLESERDSLFDNKSDLKRTKSELDDALSNVNRLKRSLEEKDELISKMKNDMSSIKELDNSFASLQQENDKFAKQINNLTEENANLRNQINPKEKETNELLKKLAELSERVETGKVALSSMNELVKEKQAHIETLKKEVKTLSQTNSNYLVAMESFSTSKIQGDQVIKSKYEDMEGAHKKILDENKRLRTVLAHKNMAETSFESDTGDLRKTLDLKEKEIEQAHERIAHLESMLDDVYKANEIKLMQRSNNINEYVNEEEAKMSVTSLPDIRYADSRATNMTAGGSYAQNYMRDKSLDTNRWASLASGRTDDLRQYRHAETYAKRYEHRPTKRGGVNVGNKKKR